MSDLPNLTKLSPAFARRTWFKWLADRREPLSAEAANDANYVELAIDEYELNHGREAEKKSLENLAARQATFEASYARTAD